VGILRKEFAEEISSDWVEHPGVEGRGDAVVGHVAGMRREGRWEVKGEKMKERDGVISEQTA
jgi:hypothetical protein